MPLGPHPVRRRLLRGADDRRISCPGCARMAQAGRGVAGGSGPCLSAARRACTAFASYTVPTSLELEDRTERLVTLYGLLRLSRPVGLVPPPPPPGSTGPRRSPSARPVADDIPHQALAIRLRHAAQHDQNREAPAARSGLPCACCISSSKPVAVRCASPCHWSGDSAVKSPVPATFAGPSRTTASRGSA